MCEPDKRKEYTFCKETKLVRIVLDTINDEYSACITRLLEYVKVRKLVMLGNKAGETEVSAYPASHDRSFNDDWLPSWALLQEYLLEEHSIKNEIGR